MGEADGKEIVTEGADSFGAVPSSQHGSNHGGVVHMEEKIKERESKKKRKRTVLSRRKYLGMVSNERRFWKEVETNLIETNNPIVTETLTETNCNLEAREKERC